MENGDNAETGLTDAYLAPSYAVMEGKLINKLLYCIYQLKYWIVHETLKQEHTVQSHSSPDTHNIAYN